MTDQRDDRPELDLDEARERWHDHLARFIEEAPNPPAAVAITLNATLVLALEVCGRNWTQKQLIAALENVSMSHAGRERLV